MADRIDPFQDFLCLCAPPILVINVPNKLYMSCPPGNTNIVSFSPGGEHDRLCIPSSRSSFTPISMHPPPQQSAYPPSQPRFMYPTSGFYYNLMQNSSHTASQTTIPCTRPVQTVLRLRLYLLRLHIYLHLCIPHVFRLIHQFLLVTFTLGIRRQQMSIVRPLFLMVYHPTHRVFCCLSIANCCQILL